VVKRGARFQSDIELGRDGTMANAKSIRGVRMLAAEQGALVVIRADGSDEAEAIAALAALVEGGFGE